MNQPRFVRLIRTLTFALLASLPALSGHATPSDPGWPRQYSNGGAELVVYQPQVDSWNDFKLLRGRCAFALTTARGREPVYGTFRFQGDTLVDADRKVALLRNIRTFDLRFPSAPATAVAQLTELTAKLLPSDAVVLSLDRLLAYVRAGEVPHRAARVLSNPPPIFVSSQPAVLVILDGQPVLADLKETPLRRVVNTNWDLYQDRRTNAFYLRNDGSWLSAPSLQAQFTPALSLPSGLEPLPPAAHAPRVLVTYEPAELIVTDGAPVLAPVAGQLMAVTNTESDLFFHASTRAYYFLASGRWFSAASLQGPWQFSSDNLPEEFKAFPPDHPRVHILAAVPGTREAEDAVLLAAIPRKAEVKRSEANAEVSYAGAPQFVPIPGTPVSYAKNSPNDVLRVGDLYYLCFQGVWFVASTPNGPWQAADKVPQEIYSIPESSPKYNVTYVRVYDSTATTVVVGYTPGYYGAYVSGGVVVWGTGYYYAPYVSATSVAAPVYWGAGCYTYGASAWYNPATGVYARGSAVYGPYGGYGAAAAYNPRTGTYAQGAAIAGPYASAAAGRTYNPYTGTSSAGYNVSTPYGSRGEGVVSNGSNWARGGYQSTSHGTAAAGQTSAGGAGVAVQGANGNSGYAARSASGDIYAGANGNVYKRDEGQWYKNQNGSWNAVDKSAAEAQRQQAAARDHGNRNAQLSERQRPSFGGGARSQAPQQRPQFSGRRR